MESPEGKLIGLGWKGEHFPKVNKPQKCFYCNKAAKKWSYIEWIWQKGKTSPNPLDDKVFRFFVCEICLLLEEDEKGYEKWISQFKGESIKDWVLRSRRYLLERELIEY